MARHREQEATLDLQSSNIRTSFRLRIGNIAARSVTLGLRNKSTCAGDVSTVRTVTARRTTSDTEITVKGVDEAATGVLTFSLRQ